MKIDLCKIFGVEEGEEFGFKTLRDGIYKVENNVLLKKYKYADIFDASRFLVNEIANYTVVKLPKKKQFTDDELAIMRSLPKEYEWIARDYNGDDDIFAFCRKPKKEKGIWTCASIRNNKIISLDIFNHIFKSIKWTDKEPVFIDDYVER